MKRGYLILTVLLLFALVLTACNVPNLASLNATHKAPQEATHPSPTAPPRVETTSPSVSPGAVAALEGTLSRIYEEVNPSVVNIKVTRIIQETPFSTTPTYQRASGSGMVWDKEGHIVTNNHVVEGAKYIHVFFADGTEADATLVGTDPDSDLAVIKVDVDKALLHPVTVGDSTRVKVGQLAIAIGNPFALTGTMTVGIISALGRVLPTEEMVIGGGRYVIPDIIQTDAPINPGNSGGPLLNSKGEVIGVTTAIASPVRASAGIGFAVPSIIVKKVVPQLIEKGYYEHPWLGVSIETLTPRVAKIMGLPETQRGALIVNVLPDSPADKAGLRGSDRQVTLEIDGREVKVQVGGDVIVAIDGHPVRSSDELLTYLARYTHAGQKVTLTILRQGKKMDVEVTLGVRPTQKGREKTAEGEASGRHQAWLGILGVDVTPKLAEILGLPEDQRGVLIESVVQGSPADKAGLRGSYKPVMIGDQEVLIGGDIIVAFDGQPVTSLRDLLGYLRQHKPGDKVTLTILRDGEKMDVTVTLGKRPKR